MRTTCEVMVHEILPGLRAMIARELSEHYDMSQSDIAASLGVSQPAISQYIRALRGRRLRVLNNTEIQSEIKATAKNIHGRRLDSDVFTQEVCRICRLVSMKRLIETTYGEAVFNAQLCSEGLRS